MVYNPGPIAIQDSYQAILVAIKVSYQAILDSYSEDSYKIAILVAIHDNRLDSNAIL